MAGRAFIGTSGWRAETPPAFRFAIKAHRYLTQNKKLKDALPGIRLERLAGFARALRAWARKARRWMGEGRDVHVYFDNDAYGDAPRNATRLLALLSRRR